MNTLKPFIIPIFLPQAGCSHKCVFCDQYAITGSRKARPDLQSVTETIHTFLTYNHRKHSEVQLSFYGGNFLGLPENYLIQLLELAQSFVNQKQIDSIRFSTRPDTVTQNQLQLLKNYAIKTVELGVQSMDDHVLLLSQRGHKAIDSCRATECLKDSGYQIGHQLMIGLPGETEDSFYQSVTQVIRMRPDFVRLYPAVVLKGSLLADEYTSGRYHPLSLEKAVTLAKKSWILFHSHKIPVIRMGLHSQKDIEKNILAGPFHPAFGHMVHSERMFDRVTEKINRSHSNEITILANPEDMSPLIGIQQSNLKKLRSQFPKKRIQIVSDPGIKDICILENLKKNKGG
ncbi:MAG: radical SAM protein [Candidatus Magnetomorum sp.]|nr:radical SAM protein [Candidatus Magnetomorum sp.]